MPKKIKQTPKTELTPNKKPLTFREQCVASRDARAQKSKKK